MKEMWIDFKKTFVFLKGHQLKYGLGITGMTIMRASAALLQAYLLNLFLKTEGTAELTLIAKIFFWMVVYVAVIAIFLPVFQFWFNGQAKYAHGSVNKAIYKKYGELPPVYFEKNHSGKILSLFLNDTWLIAVIVMRHFRRVVAALITIAIYLVPMFVMDFRISVILLITNLLTMIVSQKVTKHLKKLTRQIQKKMEEMTVTLTEMISGMSVVRIYNMYETIQKSFSRENDAVFSLNRKKSRIVSALAAYNYGIYIFNLIVFLFVGSILVKMHLSSFGNILAIMSLQVVLSENFRELVEFYPQLFNGLVATERVYEFLEWEDNERKNGLESSKTGSFIELKNISFSYPDSETNAVSDFSMAIEEGEHVALVGESGCGKSTIAKLLLGMYEADSGSIRIGGKDMLSMTKRELLQNISYVPQDAGIFSESVYENIRYGRYDATEEEIREAAKKANAYEFIEALPMGFDTVLTENGSNLSGGQRQRIAIARALLKNAPVLIMDEATSALDNESEQQILASIQSLAKQKTIITIAHRSTTIQSADRIIEVVKKEVSHHNK